MKQMQSFADRLKKLAEIDRKRTLILPDGKDFSSNDYLGLTHSEFLRDAARNALDSGIAHGSGGSRLLGGNAAEHEALEEFAAEFYGSEASLFFATGFAANVALFATLPQRGDLLLHDALIHASAHDGMRLGRADYESFEHNDLNDLEQHIATYRANGGTGTIWIAVESLYSMDGDIAPLQDLLDIANANEAMLIIDEAHAVGVFGDKGRGLSAELPRQDNIITLRTCGKALGLEGALINMPQLLQDFMINHARPFIFSTAPSPLTAHLVQQAILHVGSKPEIQQSLQRLIAFAHDIFDDLSPNISQPSQILPIIIGDDGTAMQIAQTLQNKGFDVRGIRPPTVPAGTARLRISLTLNIEQADIAALYAAVCAAWAQEKAA